MCVGFQCDNRKHQLVKRSLKMQSIVVLYVLYLTAGNREEDKT